MARRRSRRRYGSMVEIPGLGMMNKSVNTTDVLVGVALGFGGTVALKALGNSFFAGKLPDVLVNGSPLVGGALTGAAAYMLESKKNKQKATAHAFGAVLAGAAVQGWDILKKNWKDASGQPVLGDVVSLKFQGYGHQGRMGSVIVNEQTPIIGPGGASLSGLIVDDAGRSLSDANLSQLAGISMGDDDSSGLEELMGA